MICIVVVLDFQHSSGCTGLSAVFDDIMGPEYRDFWILYSLTIMLVHFRNVFLNNIFVPSIV